MSSSFTTMVKAKLLALLMFSFSLMWSAFADSITLQFFLGGFEELPEGVRGILVADTNEDGFNSVYLAAADGTELLEGAAIGGSDDVILAVTEARSSGFASGTVGFAETISQLDYDALGVNAGDPVQFFWFSESSSGLTAIPANVGFESFRSDQADTGGDIAYVLPPSPGVYTLSHLEGVDGGAAGPITPEYGIVGPINSQPSGGGYTGGDEVILSVGTQGTETHSFEWFEGEVGDESTPVGSGSDSLVLPAVTYNATYWVKVTDSTGSVSSMPAQIEVTGGGLRPELSWDQITGAEWYNLYIQKDGKLFSSFWLQGNDTTTWQPQNNLGAGHYKWWVRGWSSAGGYTGWVEQSAFSIAVPEILTPTGPQPEGEWQPDITWTRSLGSEWYNLYIQRNGALWKSHWIQGFDATSWTPDADLPMGEYKVWVAPWSSTHRLGPYSEPASFSVGMPVPLGPSGEVARGEVATLELSWEASSKNEWIQVYLQRNAKLWASKWIKVSDGTSWPFEDPVLPSGEYKWWIQAWNTQDSTSPWVAGPEFTIGGVQEITPQRGATITGNPRPQFQWEPEPGAQYHQFYLARGTTVVFFDWIEGSANWTPDFDLIAGEYVWWLRSWRSDTSMGPWVGAINFTVE